MGRTTVLPRVQRVHQTIEIQGQDTTGQSATLRLDEEAAVELVLSLTHVLGAIVREGETIFQEDQIGAFRVTTKPELAQGRWTYVSIVAVAGEDYLRFEHDSADAAELGHGNLVRWLRREVVS